MKPSQLDYQKILGNDVLLSFAKFCSSLQCVFNLLCVMYLGHTD